MKYIARGILCLFGLAVLVGLAQIDVTWKSLPGPDSEDLRTSLLVLIVAACGLVGIVYGTFLGIFWLIEKAEL